MSQQIQVAWIDQFTDNLLHQYQQPGSKLRGTVRERTCTGMSDAWDRLSPVEAVVKTVRGGDTPQLNTPHSRRLATLEDWEWSDLIDKQDAYRVLIDPQSAYVENGGKAMRRAFDQSVIAAFDADVKAGNEGQATVTFASEAAGNHDFSNTALTVADITALKADLDGKDVPEEGRHIVMPPSGFAQLLKQSSFPNLNSADYNAVKALVKGKIKYFLGFNWHKSTLLPSPGPNLRYGYAWHWAALGMSISQDIVTQVMERADKSYSLQVSVSGSFAGVRIFGEGVCRFLIDESK